jgi:uncharacterized protein YjbJ (UPF0337 family)
MDEHRMTGAVKNVGGKVEEAFGRATGDASVEELDHPKGGVRRRTDKVAA